jgi:hypothetical protein
VTPQPKLRPTAPQLVAELAALEGEARSEAAAAQAAAVAAARGSRTSPPGQPGTPGSVTPGDVTPGSVTPGRSVTPGGMARGDLTPQQMAPEGPAAMRPGGAPGANGGVIAAVGAHGSPHAAGHAAYRSCGSPQPRSPRHAANATPAGVHVRLPAVDVMSPAFQKCQRE